MATFIANPKYNDHIAFKISVTVLTSLSWGRHHFVQVCVYPNACGIKNVLTDYIVTGGLLETSHRC